MEKVLYPEKKSWNSLTERPVLSSTGLDTVVDQVFNDVMSNGDDALRGLTEKFDGVRIGSFKVDPAMILASSELIDKSLKDAINLARKNIEKFHESQKEGKIFVDTSAGVCCWRESRPIEKVGLYIPGGSAPLFSTVLMLAIPARLAGCKEIILCSPPGPDGVIHPAILYSALVTGVTSVYTVGGIQAIAAMTLGTETIPAVYKIFGPGNQYVTAAKQRALKHGTAIDMPAGPSELLVIADSACNADFVAADLLSQAEHGSDSQVMILSDDNEVIDKVMKSLERQLPLLPRRLIAAAALGHSKAILMKTLDECIDLSNCYAPEHLIIATDNPARLIGKVTNAGSVFLGHFSCESAGDYATGTNHTLPTNGNARSYSGVSLDSFVKKITFQEITSGGLSLIGNEIIKMAETEGLTAHAKAISVRLKQGRNG